MLCKPVFVGTILALNCLLLLLLFKPSMAQVRVFSLNVFLPHVC